MDDFEEDIPKFDIPVNIEVPISHDIPSTTLESLTQIRNEFAQKLGEATTNNDTSKKRRYQRQLKQYEDAIKATKEGKTFNFNELVVPPGFARIPLHSDGRPILSVTQPSRNNPAPSRPISQASKTTEKYDNISNNEEASDDLLEQLENEIDENDLGDDGLDPEDDHISKQLNSLLPNIKKILPKDALIDDDFDKKLAAFKPPELLVEETVKKPNIPKSNSNRQIDQNISPPAQPVIRKSPNKPNKELNILLERQRLFKEAALEAKKQGNVNIALVYLRNSKGFDTMILAAENGLPVDMTNLPVPPQMQQKASPSKQTITSSLKTINNRVDEKIDEPISGDRNSVYKRLMDDLREQVKIATENYKHFTQMGDVNNANKFNQIARESIKDLDSLKTAFSHGEDVPLYHYEKRTYQTIDCNSDLTDNDLELTVIRAINLPLPKEFDEKHMNTYVKFEFPYPPEDSQTGKTAKISATLNPEFNQTFKLQIQRKNAKFARLMNRKDLKLEIYYKAGLLKADKILGTSSIKLQHLENSSTIHDAFDLLEGRKQLGGKIEAKIRIREPILHKTVQNLELKWLIIDKFIVGNTAAL